MKTKILVVSIVSLVILSIGKANEPLPEPYYEYNISGYLENVITKKNSNYTLQLYRLINSKYSENKWVQCPGLNKSGERPYFITDSTGYFSLKVCDRFLFDSLKIGIINPLKTEYGNTHYVDSHLLTPYEVEYRDNSRSGCSGCSTEPVMYKRIEKYIYNYHDYKLILNK